MSRFLPNPKFATNLKGKVVVLTGGGNGIGASIVTTLSRRGAHVVYGDLVAGQNASGVTGMTQSAPGTVNFLKTDVTNYDNLVSLFQFALDLHGRVDCAISNAGVNEIGNFVDMDLDLTSVKMIPSKATLDVNLLGSLYFSRIAVVYLKQGQQPADDKSLTLMASLASFKESPGMPVYQASKHGVLGLMRCLRVHIPQSARIRVNAVCPWFVDTAMVSGIAEEWRKAKLPINTPEGVANIMAGVVSEEGMTGKAIYAEGDRAWEIDDNITRLEPQWLGEENSKTLARGQALMAGHSGTFWQK